MSKPLKKKMSSRWAKRHSARNSNILASLTANKNLPALAQRLRRTNWKS